MPVGLRWLDYAVSKWGRKYSLAIFAGASSFLIVAAGMVGAYSASNAVVERAHAHHAVPPRASGSVPEKGEGF